MSHTNIGHKHIKHNNLRKDLIMIVETLLINITYSFKLFSPDYTEEINASLERHRYVHVYV